MNEKKIAVLGVIAVVVAGLAFLQSRYNRTYKSPQITISPLIEGLDIDQVQTIVVTPKDAAEPIRLDRRDDAFVVSNKEDYPADMKKVNALISNCLDMRIASDAVITANPDNHAELGVTPETAKFRIEFLNGDQEPKVIVGLLISDSKMEGDRSVSHVRLASGNEVYRMTDIPYFSTRPMDYVDTQILKVDRDQVVRVTVTDPNQSSYTLTSPPDGTEIVMESMPAGKQFKGSNASSLFGSLSYFRIDDVLPSAKAPSLEFNHSYVCELKNHVLYTVRLAKDKEKTYARVSARYTGPEPEVQKQVESEDKLKEREALFLAKDTAEAFNHRNSGWIYVIPSYKAEEMTRTQSDLLEDIPAPKPEADAAKTASPAPAAETPEAAK